MEKQNDIETINALEMDDEAILAEIEGLSFSLNNEVRKRPLSGVKIKAHVRMKDLPEEARPLEKMMRHGIESLSDTELLAILIGSGTGDRNALDVARNLQGYFNIESDVNHSLMGAEPEELMRISGIGQVKACTILAGIEYGRRLATTKARLSASINHPGSIAALFNERLKSEKKEIFMICLLNTKNQIFAEYRITEGILNASLVHPREVFSPAIRRNANAIICIHNHPSGDPSPSKEDFEVTRRLVESGKLLGIPVLDHIIIGWDDYYSFKAHNMMER